MGDGAKQIWATEYGAPTGGAGWSVSERMQAAQIAQAISLWKSYPWAGVLLIHTLRDPADIGPASHEHWYGLLREDGTAKPAAAAFRAGAR